MEQLLFAGQLNQSMGETAMGCLSSSANYMKSNNQNVNALISNKVIATLGSLGILKTVCKEVS